MNTADTSMGHGTVFLVDDDSSTANLYSTKLEQAGFRTELAFDKQAACDVLPNLSADLIILNLMLPKRGGFELLEAIRSDSRHKDTPVLVLSNAYLPEMAQKALKAGGNKALSKSQCTSSELISVSRQLVGISEVGGPDQPAAVCVSGTENSPGAWVTTDLAEQLKKDLIEAGSIEVAAIRERCLRYVEVAGSEEGKEHLDNVYQGVRFLSTRAGLAGCAKISQLTGAIEAMLYDQVFRSNNEMSQSSIQTLAQAIQCLERLFISGDTESGNSTRKARVFLVDDDEVSNKTNEMALKRANYDTVSATNGLAALILLNKNPFDLILLDINMPGMNGIELCQKLRCIPQHKNTPVIFVTLRGDFESRARSLMSGGDDLISKPISPLELIVKATVFLLDTSRRYVPKEQPHIENHASPSDSPSADKNPEGDSPSQILMAEQPKLEDGAKKLNTFQATVNEKLKYLKEALAEETQRREAVEEQAAENTRRRSKLESAIEENQRSQEKFRQLLEESEKQAL